MESSIPQLLFILYSTCCNFFLRREPRMEIFVSAVLGELTSRSINFFINKRSRPSELDVEDRLCRVLLRVQVIIDEAMGRHITSQTMLQQLGMLRDAMLQGCYMLDAFKYRSCDDEGSEGQHVSGWSSVSKVSFLKGFSFTSKNTHILKQLQQELDNLNSMMLDVEELIMFLASCPRMYRQPYSMHILLGNCMFGRQMEAQLVINFLLHRRPHGTELEVLPIVGPGRVGKSTLIAHVCHDERIRDHFAEIIILRDHDFRNEWLSVLRDGSAIEHQNCASKADGRLLVVIEVVGDVNEDAWKKLCAAPKMCVANSTKIIITSRSDKITKFGTTGAVALKYLSDEAHWYLFKTLTFGSTDPEEHPRFAYLAMEFAKMHHESFICVNIYACMLRENFDIHFWRKVVAFKSGAIHKHISEFGKHPSNLLNQGRPARLEIMGTSEDFIVHDQYQCFSQEEVPNITFQDVVYGNIKPQGKFDILTWRSRIPPYHSFIYNCEIREAKTSGMKRKRTTENGVTIS